MRSERGWQFIYDDLKNGGCSPAVANLIVDKWKEDLSAVRIGLLVLFLIAAIVWGAVLLCQVNSPRNCHALGCKAAAELREIKVV